MHATARILLALAALAAPAAAQNLLQNGDFSAGNTGFATDYFYSHDFCSPEGSYDVVHSSADCHGLWSDCVEHTDGTGLMMVLNGQNTGRVAWSQTVSVAPMTNYAFSFWACSVYPSNPARLRVYVNGEATVPIHALSSTPCQWQFFSATWNSRSSVTATIALVDENDVNLGNDFALDDLELRATGEVTLYCSGKTSSLGCIPFLSIDGAPSATSPSPFRVVARDAVPDEAGILLYGYGRSNLAFHGGRLCVQPALVRLPPRMAKSVGPWPCAGVLTRNFNQIVQSGANPVLTTGQTVTAQWYQRDPANTVGGAADTLTDAVEFTIQP